MRDRWLRPPPEVVEEIRSDPVAKQQADVQEAAAFGAFMGAFQQTQTSTGRGG